MNTTSASRAQPGHHPRPRRSQIRDLFQGFGRTENNNTTPKSGHAAASATWVNFLGLGKYQKLPFHSDDRASSPILKRREELSAWRKWRDVASFIRRRFVALLPFFALALFLVTFCIVNASKFWPRRALDLTRYVNVFRGVENGGGMFPGVVPVPFSVVKIGPDCEHESGIDAYSGYLPDGNVTGFSLLHESGTGGAPKYGVISQMPVLGAVANPLQNLSTPRMARDYGEVGYFRSWLKGGIKVEIAGTNHAAMMRYSFSAGGYENSIVVDVSHVLRSSGDHNWSQDYVKGSFQLFEDGHYEGFGEYKGGWNLSPNYVIYFCGYFNTAPVLAQAFSGAGEELHHMGEQSFVTGSQRLGGVFTFREKRVNSRIGISWMSTERACQYVEDEIPEDSRFADLTSHSKERWNKEVLGKIQTNSDAIPEHLRELYSNLYSMYILPTNRTGENPNWNSEEPYYDDIVTYWDLFRCSMALTHIITPDAHRDQLRSLIDIWKHEGWLPDARSSDWTGQTQGGSNADNILADAFVKGVDLNWADAYEAMMKNAEVVPPNEEDPRAPDSSTRWGRGALPDWKDYGYITPTFSRAVSRAIEYAGNDFSLHQVAKGLGRPEAEVEYYLNRSRYWRNHWNPDQKSLGFSGFLVPRYANGSFEHPYDPLQCGDCYWEDPYYAALPWEYTFAAGHHDMAYVINITGGEVTFIRKLQRIFEQWVYKPNAAYNETILDPSNEPSFNTPWLFHYVNRQDLSVKYARRSAQFYYGPGRDGLPSNSDSGAIQSWQLWNMIGLYPMVGQRIFLIGSPWFKLMKIDLGRGKKLEITMKGGNVNSEAFYVHQVRVNGKSWVKNWVDWSDLFENGGQIHFDVSHTPIPWAYGEVPPSPASEAEYILPLKPPPD